jgi:hypothetical protein
MVSTIGAVPPAKSLKAAAASQGTASDTFDVEKERSMPDLVKATACPHCGKELKIPQALFGKVLRCKACHKTFVPGKHQAAKPVEKAAVKKEPSPLPEKQAEPTKPPAAAVEAKQNMSEPAVVELRPEPSGLAQQIARRQRWGSVFFILMLLLAIGGIGTGVYVFKDRLLAAFDQIARPTATQSQLVQEDRPPIVDPDVILDERSGDLTTLPMKEPGKKTRRSFARIPAPYPGRALLVGVRNYLYLNPLNPGYRPERSLMRDPLGLMTLQRVLITEHSFPREQTAVLCDVDEQKPMQPTKATIESNVEEFLKTTRASDRIILAFVCHVTVIGDQAYLLPMEAELPPEGAKPDAERDTRLIKQYVSVKWLYEKLAACPARQKLLILDVAQHDPEAGLLRSTAGPMDEKLHGLLKAAPKDTQVWLACGAKQQSHLFHSSGQDGSVFMDTLCHTAVLTTEKNWKLIEKDPGLKLGTLPLALLAKHVTKETTEYVKQRAKAAQVPELIGQEGTFTGTPAAEPPPPVALKAVKPSGDFASADNIRQLLKELSLDSDPARALAAESFPALPKGEFAKYAADYKNATELEGQLKDRPLRVVTLKAIKALNKSEKSFKMRFAHEDDEARFKKMVEREQEVPAYVTSELNDILEEMKALAEKRDAEPSKRWQAHFDYTMARVLARLANVQEYGFVLGNKLRKDTPKLSDPANHNGWVIVPQRKLEQKETRSFDAERQKLAAKIIKDYPGTPWEVLARREQATILGLTLQEAYLDEGRRVSSNRR